MSSAIEWVEYHLDAKTFQKQLDQLTNTIALKVQREGPKLLPKPEFVCADIYVLLRQAHHTYNLFCFLNADDRRKKDSDWKVPYSVVTLPLVRCMIDCLYNITAILANPGVKGYAFRESGYKQALAGLDADERRYGGNPKWDTYLGTSRRMIDLQMRSNGITEDDVKAARIWPTLSGYLRAGKGSPLTPHQEFLRKLTFGFWQEYSGMAHGTFQGLMRTAAFYLGGDVPHEDRAEWERAAEKMIAMNLSRVAAVLLCTITEVQAYFRFDGAHINQRLHAVWNALIIVPEIKELHYERYGILMKDRGMYPD